MLPGTAPSLLTWHLHPGCEHGTSEAPEIESPLAWSQIIKIMAFHLQNFLESQFASEPVTPVCIWISCDIERGCLCLLNLRRMQGRKGVEKGIKLLLSMKNLQWVPKTLPCSQGIAVSPQGPIAAPLEQPHWQVAPPSCSEVRKEWKGEIFPASKTKLMLVSLGLKNWAAWKTRETPHFYLQTVQRWTLC